MFVTFRLFSSGGGLSPERSPGRLFRKRTRIDGGCCVEKTCAGSDQLIV